MRESSGDSHACSSTSLLGLTLIWMRLENIESAYGKRSLTVTLGLDRNLNSSDTRFPLPSFG